MTSIFKTKAKQLLLQQGWKNVNVSHCFIFFLTVRVQGKLVYLAFTKSEIYDLIRKSSIYLPLTHEL